jgi:hypothetical protein
VRPSARVTLSALIAVSLTPVVTASAAVSRPRAPNAPPLAARAPASQGEETAGIPSAAGDQLVENGLSSPFCASSTRGALSRAAQSNCETSDFVGAPVPTNDYELDVHIDTGAFGISKGTVASVVQDTFLAFGWMAIVWCMHALVVMLECGYALELVDGSTIGEVAHSLQHAQASVTEPWLALVLSVTSILALYNGLVRRRAAEALGQALLTLAMMVGGLWVIVDPLGTVGVVSQWANQATLSTVGAFSQGTSSNSPRTLADGMRAVFSGAIEAPWCYLEFGNVRWCSDPTLLEPRLRKAASALLRANHGNASTAATHRTEELLRDARTNGELFLAFPANGRERNSVKESGSLLHVICQAEDDTKCKGPAATEAEFRSDGGTVPRMIGLAMIGFGTLGMGLLFGFVALRLMTAAAMALFLLLLAPFAVLAPAFGDSGQALFTGWVTRLLGVIGSKLIFSFVLVALLAVQRVLISLHGLGWLSQWLLISTFWWAVFFKRHQAVALLRNRGRSPAPSSQVVVAEATLKTSRTTQLVLRPVRWAREKLPA